ncbi:hypothetical protein ABGB19_02825 [Mycobacterium sp. B14F4]|uniref:hypothetical protein n=1 Tax=Mycobacterium sp. B14F4 TaxID=3153565 RepID=UPI00325E1ADB
MTKSAVLRPVLITVSAALAAGWLVACAEDEGTNTETTTVETTQTSENDGTIEIPSPNIEIPDVTVSPNP